jgi:hypothetical protein
MQRLPGYQILRLVTIDGIHDDVGKQKLFGASFIGGIGEGTLGGTPTELSEGKGILHRGMTGKNVAIFKPVQKNKCVNFDIKIEMDEQRN